MATPFDPPFAGSIQPPDVPPDPTGDEWRGEPGPPGATGATGATGPQGPAGPAGADGATYTLPTASTVTLGGVKVDGASVTINGSGVISATATGGVSSFNTRTGAVTLSSGDVTAALGFTPYNATNPAGYQTATQVTTSLAPYAPLASPTLTGDPKAPTPTAGDNDTSIATTAFVQTALGSLSRRKPVAVATASIPNVGASTSEEVAVVWTIPAGLLANVGDVIHAVIKMELAATTDSKTMRTRFGTSAAGLTNGVTSAMTCNAVATLHAVTELWIIKTGANTQKSWSTSMNANNNIVSADSTLALTDTGTLYLSITLQNSTAAVPGSLTVFAAMVEYLPGV